MEDKENKQNKVWIKPCLEHCEAYGISKAIINAFIHIQEQKHERDHREAAKVFEGIQLSLDIKMEPTKQVKEK